MNDNYYYYNYNYDNYNNNGIHSTAFPQNGSSSAGIQVINLSNIGQAAGQHWGDSPTPFKKCCGFFKVPHIELKIIEVGRHR